MNNIYSHILHVTSGVPQGKVLGPTLLLLSINDISSIFKELDVKLKLFADDIKLYSTYYERGSQSDLFTAVNRLYNWICTWQMQIATVLFVRLLIKVKTLLIVFMVLITMYLLMRIVFET